MSKKLPSLKSQVYQEFQDMLAPGTSKHKAKQDGSIRDIVVSYGTYQDYRSVCNRFVTYCKENYGCKTLDECRPYTDVWVKKKKKNGKSYPATTMKTYASALSKLYHCTMKEIAPDLPVRRRQDITNSRGNKTHWSRTGEYAPIMDFVDATGLRCSELKMLKGNDFNMKNGELFVIVRKGKNGKYREAQVIQNSEWVKEVMQKAGEKLVFSKIPKQLHRYRAEYATTYYKMLARPLEKIPREERYYCRRDLKSIVYDKKAMKIVSEALGHSRISVIASSYLREL